MPRQCELRCGKMRFYCTALAVLLALADCFAQQEQRTLQHRMAPMYRMPEPRGTQPHFLANETHVSAGDPFDDRLAQLLSHPDGGVQATQAPEADVISPALSLAGLDKQCSSSLLCYCCRWTIRTRTSSMCDVPQYVTVEEPVCVQIVDGRCVQTEVQTRQEERRATSGTCDKQTAQRTCARCCRTHLAVSYASLQCSAPTRVTSQDVALPTPSPHERHTAHRRSVEPHYSPTQAYAAPGSGDMRAYRSCCSSASRRACCTSAPVQVSSRGASPGSGDALARCCGTGAATAAAPYSSHATFDAGDAPQPYRPAATCCAAYNPPSCCFSQSANIRAFCCQDDRGAGRQVAAVEVAPPSCCTTASRMSCCEAAAPSVRPQCCTSRAASRQEMEAALTAGVGQVSEDECCSVDVSLRSSCCRRFSSPALVRCCYRVDTEPQRQAAQPAVARTQPECCTTPTSLRDACCSAAMASVQQVRCCTRRQQQPSAALMPAASDCCTTGSGPRPACCRTTFSQAARATCCDSMLYPAQDTCCSSSTAAALLRCCAAILHPSPCCATRLVAAPLPTTTMTTTTTTTPPPPETPPPWSLPCCTASSPSFRDACCASVSVQLVMLMPCCTQTRAFSSALMSSCCTAAQAQSSTPCCSTSSSTERDGSMHTVTRCCSSSSSSSSSSYQSSYQSSSLRDASPSCCGRTGVVLGSCCAVYGGQQRALPRCCASTSSVTSHMSSDAISVQRDLSCCTRSSSEVAQCCASLPLTPDFPPCCSASSSSSSYSALAARQQPQPASCCTGTALARAQCCSSHTLTQLSAPSCCSSSLQSASAWAALPGQQAAPSCCHTTASSRLPCCASTAYLASCCQNIRRMHK